MHWGVWLQLCPLLLAAGAGQGLQLDPAHFPQFSGLL